MRTVTMKWMQCSRTSWHVSSLSRSSIVMAKSIRTIPTRLMTKIQPQKRNWPASLLLLSSSVIPVNSLPERIHSPSMTLNFRQ